MLFTYFTVLEQSVPELKAAYVVVSGTLFWATVHTWAQVLKDKAFELF